MISPWTLEEVSIECANNNLAMWFKCGDSVTCLMMTKKELITFAEKLTEAIPKDDRDTWSTCFLLP